jgi:DNA-binding transcriptional MerR regulator
VQSYSIRDVAKLSGLSESTLRYYETIGLIPPIRRDSSSKHRTYGEPDVNFAVAIACLSATGMSIADMRTYLRNRGQGAQVANQQLELLEKQEKRLAEEAQNLKLRQGYVDAKIAYWKAVESSDPKRIEAARLRANAIAQELRLPKVLEKVE